MADAFTPVNGIIRKVAAIDEVVNGIIHKTPKIPVPVNGVIREGYVAFDPTLPTYSANLTFETPVEGEDVSIIEFVTIARLQEAVAAGYSKIQFTLTIDNSASTLRYRADTLAVNADNTNFYLGQVLNPVPTGNTTQTFTVNTADVLNTMETYFPTKSIWLTFNDAQYGGCSDKVYVSLSNAHFTK